MSPITRHTKPVDKQSNWT